MSDPALTSAPLWQTVGAFAGGLVVGGLGWAKALVDYRTAKTNLERANIDLKKVQPAVNAVAKAFKADYEVAELAVEFLMRDDRSITYRRHYKRIKAREETTEVHIPYSMEAPHGTVSPPKLTPTAGSLEGLTMRPSRHNSPHRYRGHIILPAHAIGNGQEVGFSVEQQVTNAFVLTREEGEKIWTDTDAGEESFGAVLTVTVARLVMEVEFPPKLSGKNVTARPNVYYGESDILNAEEVQRLRELGKVESIGQSRFRLTMPHPAKGQMYALVWDPPPDAEVTVS